MSAFLPSQDTLCVTIDLDGLSEYGAIHGLEDGHLTEAQHALMYTHALPRFLTLVERLNIRATLFVIGRDLAHSLVATSLRQALARGHELGNHSFAHDYRLSVLPHQQIGNDLRSAHAGLVALGTEVVGFRAPGYHLSPALLDEVRALRYRYDASRLPSPLYYGAKVAAIAAGRVRGRASHSHLGSPFDFAPRRTPYAIAPQLCELPISTLGPLRLPLTGLLLAPSGATLTRLLARWARALAFVQIEFHGIDFLDAAQDELTPAIYAAQPELHVPLTTRLARFENFMQTVCRTHNPRLLRDLTAPTRTS